MSIQKYSVNQHPIQTLLSWVNSSEIAIPEIQRPFVWNATDVRNLIDSLFQGFPVGYLIAWRNPSVRLKDGSNSDGKRILIDGQQRVTALMASILGSFVINKDYRKAKISIAFNPMEQKFEVTNPAIQKDKTWIPDISKVLNPEFKTMKFVKEYCQLNSIDIEDEIYDSIELLKGIVNNPIGLIELNSDLDIETVTEIFIRINSKGVVLSQADFAMSKIAANENYDGSTMRKCIDYFCHLAIAPDFYPSLTELDPDFTKTEYFQKMTWLKNENDDIYDPSYTDMLRVAFTSEFKRGRLQDLVALLSGRNFETRIYEEEIAEESFNKLKAGLLNFMNETNFKRFVMIVRSAGFIDSSMIRSQNVLNFAYIVYLVLRKANHDPNEIESLVRKWLVMSILTGRYSGSPESTFDFDIKRVNEYGVENYLNEIISAELSDAFWDAGLPQQMNTSVASSPYFNVYLASQVYNHDKGFLSKDISVQDLILNKGDVHHIFPKNYLKKVGMNRGKYNQIANYVIMQSEINIAIGDKAPSDYFTRLFENVNNGNNYYGAIKEPEKLDSNLAMHCIPKDINKMESSDYEKFLLQRRVLMSKKIKEYFKKL